MNKYYRVDAAQRDILVEVSIFAFFYRGKSLFQQFNTILPTQD